MTAPAPQPAPESASAPAAARSVADAVGGLDPVGLGEVLERAELQVRLDRKYLVPAAAFPEVVARLDGAYAALEIGGLRSFRYASTYFDTPDLLTYRQHRQGRRRRYKIRTRGYLDGGGCLFEVKLAGARDSTDKRRMPYDPSRGRELTPDARGFLADALLSAYRMNAPDGLRESATTAYRRTTLVQRSGTGRFTCDVGLVCSAGGGPGIAAVDGIVLLESKSAAADAPVDRVLRGLGIRPLSLSKYCLAVAVLYPGTPANPWHRALRRCFGAYPL